MIFINGQEYHYDISKSLSELFAGLKIDAGSGIAAAVNDMVIPKTQWKTYILNDNDKIILIKATQGG